MRNSKHVRNYFCQLYPNGVYALTFNTDDRWIPFHAYDNYMYIFGEEEENETQEQWESRIQEVPEFLPKIEKGQFIETVQQNKDQVTFYFIPFLYEWINEGKLTTVIEPTNYETKHEKSPS